MSGLWCGRQQWRAGAFAALALVLAGQQAPAFAQAVPVDARIRQLEAEVRALQRKVFPGPDGKFFTPEIAAPAAAGASPTAGTPATSAVTDILTRLDSLESQIARLTAQIELNDNRLTQLEARAGIASPSAGAAPAAPAPGAAAPTPAPSAPALPQAGQANLSAMTGGASSPAPAPATAAPAPASQPGPAPAPATVPPPQAARPAAAPPAPATAAPAGPSAQRLAAVRAIEKPQTDDPGDDEYSYGFRLWDAKFYPEAQQQLKLFIDKFPRHSQISYGRNLLGRAYLDDGKPREAASWFLQNYQADKNGRRAPDSLLYLSVAMKQINDTSRACIALAEFSETYVTEAAGRLKGLYDQTRSGLSCAR